MFDVNNDISYLGLYDRKPLASLSSTLIFDPIVLQEVCDWREKGLAPFIHHSFGCSVLKELSYLQLFLLVKRWKLIYKASHSVWEICAKHFLFSSVPSVEFTYELKGNLVLCYTNLSWNLESQIYAGMQLFSSVFFFFFFFFWLLLLPKCIVQIVLVPECSK